MFRTSGQYRPLPLRPMEFTSRLKKYLKLKKRLDKTGDAEEQNLLLAELENLYYKLDEEEAAYVESKDLHF